jgi:LmbE family N-acetylglucosaminyl deacetylase
MRYNLFIFAHQDDEAAIFSEIQRSIEIGIKPIIIFLTSGSRSGFSDQRRNSESLAVLSKLGAPQKQVYFIGADGLVPDGLLIEHYNYCFNRIEGIIKKLGKPNSIYLLSWEGGHQDHDAAHLIGLKIAEKFDIIDITRQFPFYSGLGLPSIFFRLFSPITANGPYKRTYIPWKNRFKYLSYCLQYPSQWKTWLGLFPFYLVHHLLGRGQILQNVSLERVKEKPHSGKLLYERRGEYGWEDFMKVFLIK